MSLRLLINATTNNSGHMRSLPSLFSHTIFSSALEKGFAMARLRSLFLSSAVILCVGLHSASAHASLIQEAEAGQLFGDFVIANDAAASGGQYIHAPSGGQSSPNAAHRADYSIEITQAGDYRIDANVYGASGSDNSFFVTVDGLPSAGYLWDSQINTTYQIDSVSNRGGANPVIVNLEVGVHTLSIFVREDGTRLDRIELVLVQATGGSNTAPVIMNPGNQSNTEGNVIDLSVIASDVDNDTLTYSATGLPQQLSIDNGTGQISGSVIATGTFDVTLTVNDNNGGADSVNFTWLVDTIIANILPTIDSIADQSNTEGDTINLTVTASDVDGDTLTYSASGLPQLLSISSATGQITGTVNTVGSFNVIVTVNDTNSGTDSASFIWIVEALVSNAAPVITNPGNQSNTEGNSVTITIAATDADVNDILTFSVTGLPDGLNLNAATGAITGIPSVANAFNVTITVDDNNGGTDSESFTWVINANVPPPPPVDSNPISRSSTFTYDANGQILTIDGPRTDVADITTFEYDAQGNRTKSINALGQETLFTAYDASGRLLSMTDPNAVVTQLRYDPRGRLLTRIVAGVITTFDYDGVGQLIQITLPNNAQLNYTYDGARRLTDIEDNLGNRIRYTVDNMGNRTGEDIFDDTSTLRRSQTRVFDELSRLIESISANAQSTTFSYDANGNQTTTTDALSRSSQSAFDALDRLISSQDADSQITQYDYDVQDNLTSVTDARGLTTTYTYDGLDNLLQLNSPDTNTTVYAYDAAGNRISQIDARGIATVFRYDALNRLITVSYPDSQFNITYTYDQGSNGIGRLTLLQDNSGNTGYQYDARGNLTQQTYTTNGTGYTTTYTYDTADNLTQMSYPSGRIVSMNRDALGRIAQMTTSTNASASSQTLVDSLSYLPFGPVTGYAYGNGINTTYSYDQDYRLISQNSGNVLSQSYGFDAVNNITTIIDSQASANDQVFGYDNLDRLTTAQGNYGNLSYSYDAVGNRQTESQDSNNTYGYDSTTQRLTSISGANPSSLSYDANGNLINQDSTSYTYSDINRLAQATANGQNTNYRYNGRGERTQKITATGTIIYHYDQSGLLIAETDQNGNAIRDYAYLNGQRLALIDSTGVYYLHSNHLDTPQVITDQNQNIVWAANYEPFGEAQITTAEIENNLRFPGQYFDEETNLYYNYFRDYDPSVGRYTQSDPIGLDGGFNTYLYGNANPVRFIDPTGELAFLAFLPAIISGSGGGTAAAGGFSAGTALLGGLGLFAILNIPGDTANSSDDSCGRCMSATPQNIRSVVSTSTFRTLQRSVSAPVVQAFVNRIENGENPPPISVDGNIIVNGNHRIVAGLLCGQQVSTMPGTAPLARSRFAMPLSQIQVSTVDFGNR